MGVIAFVADRNEGGQRLDRLLRKRYPELPLARIFSLFSQKRVKLSGKRAIGSARVEEGDRIELYLPEELERELTTRTAQQSATAVQTTAQNHHHTQKNELSVVAEEPGEWILLDKPAGVAAHPGTGIAAGASLIEQIWRERPHFGSFKPALVHRLDKETSGLLLAALSAPALRQLSAQLRERQTEKRYLALVAGVPAASSGTISLKLQRVDSKVGGAKSVAGGAGVEAVTHWRLIERFDGDSALPAMALLQVDLGTGRLHQIRAHLSAIGHPLVGDNRYGDFALNRLVRQKGRLRRLFLHASQLHFPALPRWSAPLPPELEEFLNLLRSGVKK